MKPCSLSGEESGFVTVFSSFLPSFLFYLSFSFLSFCHIDFSNENTRKDKLGRKKNSNIENRLWEQTIILLLAGKRKWFGNTLFIGMEHIPGSVYE